MKYIFNVEKVIVEDVGNAKIKIGIGRELSASEIALAKAFNLMIRSGGVGIEEIVQFDADAVFGFLGQPNIKGFEEEFYQIATTLPDTLRDPKTGLPIDAPPKNYSKAEKAEQIKNKYSIFFDDLKTAMVTAFLNNDIELQNDLKEEYANLMVQYKKELEELKNGES